MAHTEKCPICHDRGRTPENENYQPNSNLTIYSLEKCHGCGGCGWVTVQDLDRARHDPFTPIKTENPKKKK